MAVKTCLDNTGLQIVNELYKAVKDIDPGCVGLLAILGSWGDSQSDDQILDMVRKWNAGQRG